jgi:hypothetical protein
VTDIGQYYMEPIIRPAVQPDNLAAASPSDHRIGFAKTKTCSTQFSIQFSHCATITCRCHIWVCKLGST